jgi:hypothetical protein
MEHFTRALDEQRDRYVSLEAVQASQRKQEEGRQRLLERAADEGRIGQQPLRGFRYWLARLFRLV